VELRSHHKPRFVATNKLRIWKEIGKDEEKEVMEGDEWRIE